MTTDITELAQREKFEAWAEEVGALPWGILKKHRNQDGSYPGPHYTYMWKAWQAASAEMVEALEKAQRANAAQDDHINQQQDRIEQLEKGHQEAAKQIISWRRLAKQNIAEREKDIAELEAARQRNAELESRTVKLPEPHAHLIWIQAGHAPDDFWDDVSVSHSEKDRCCDGSERYPVYARWQIEEMLTAAGIKWEAE
ncbi:hypothetical protein RRW91_07885 [Klebsiella grimontii]|uniref:hypothetical protein n=1 Tax=Klebsiella grimontii TaxID=2058152 RepID=UPI0028DAB2EE|nr:hypothetical protein [Klebsiella grimontii]MDT8622995.1 hypothetical protein [Klebsiella grimontii]